MIRIQQRGFKLMFVCLIVILHSVCSNAEYLFQVLEKAAKEKTCPFNEVKSMIARGTKPDGVVDLKNALYTHCPEIVSLIIRSSNKERAAQTFKSEGPIFGLGFFKVMNEETRRNPSNRESFEQLRKRKIDTYQAVQTTFKPFCENDKKGEPCIASIWAQDYIDMISKQIKIEQDKDIADAAEKKTRDENFQKIQEERIAREKAEEERAEAPTTLLEEACQAWHDINVADNLLKKQKAIEKEAGVINTASRYELAQMKVYAKDRLAALETKYKSKTKTALPLKTCKPPE